MKGIIYLSGPMTGLPNFNYPAFNAKETELKEQGFVVVNPAKLNSKRNTWQQAMKICLRALLDCDSIYMLPGWEASRGAMLEFGIAKALDKHLYYQEKENDPSPR